MSTETHCSLKTKYVLCAKLLSLLAAGWSTMGGNGCFACHFDQIEKGIHWYSSVSSGHVFNFLLRILMLLHTPYLLWFMNIPLVFGLIDCNHNWNLLQYCKHSKIMIFMQSPIKYIKLPYIERGESEKTCQWKSRWNWCLEICECRSHTHYQL